MAASPEAQRYAEYLQSLSESQRVDELRDLRAEARICFECGAPEPHPHACQCQNDD